MPDAQNASSGFALRTYRDPDAMLYGSGDVHALAQRGPEQPVREGSPHKQDRRSAFSLWAGRNGEDRYGSVMNAIKFLLIFPLAKEKEVSPDRLLYNF
jgi:hypothetical protein